MAAQPSSAAVGDPPDFPRFGSFHPHRPRAVPLKFQTAMGPNPNLSAGVSLKKTVAPPSVSANPRISGPQPHRRSYADVVNPMASISKPDLHLFDKASTPTGVKSFLRDGARVVSFDAAITSFLAEPFKWTLVGKFSHGVPSFTKIGKFFSSLKLIGKFKLHRLNHRQFLVNFGDESDFVRVWLGRMWHVAGFPMRMLKWSPSFDTKVESSTVPVWVRLPGMPVHLFNRDVLFEVASNLGKPIRADSDTAFRFKLSEARFCVEVDLLLPRIDHLLLEIDGKVRKQRVVYENLPEFCSFCSCIGHGVTDCFRALKQLKPAVISNVFHDPKVSESSDIDALAVVATTSQNSQMVGGLVFVEHNGFLKPFLRFSEFVVPHFMGFQSLATRFVSSSVSNRLLDLEEGEFVVEEGVEGDIVDGGGGRVVSTVGLNGAVGFEGVAVVYGEEVQPSKACKHTRELSTSGLELVDAVHPIFSRDISFQECTQVGFAQMNGVAAGSFSLPLHATVPSSFDGLHDTVHLGGKIAVAIVVGEEGDNVVSADSVDHAESDISNCSSKFLDPDVKRHAVVGVVSDAVHDVSSGDFAGGEVLVLSDVVEKVIVGSEVMDLVVSNLHANGHSLHVSCEQPKDNIGEGMSTLISAQLSNVSCDHSTVTPSAVVSEEGEIPAAGVEGDIVDDEGGRVVSTVGSVHPVFSGDIPLQECTQADSLLLVIPDLPLHANDISNFDGLHDTVHSGGKNAVVQTLKGDAFNAHLLDEDVSAAVVGECADVMEVVDAGILCVGPNSVESFDQAVDILLGGPGIQSVGPEGARMDGPPDLVPAGPVINSQQNGLQANTHVHMGKINDAPKILKPFRLFKDKRQMDKVDGILKSGFLRKPVRNVQVNKPRGASKDANPPLQFAQEKLAKGEGVKTPLQLAQEELAKGGAFHDFVITDSHTSKPFSNMDFMARMSWADEMEDDVD